MESKKAQDINKVIKDHQESVKKQDALYQKNLASKFRPVGAGLDSDDLSKVASVDAIGKGSGSEDLKK
jgi:hypothetical protein